MNIAKIFGNSGLIAQAMQCAYEYRPQQAAMAQAVEKALDAGTHLIVEAGTGVGKSLAYLVPLILWARRENRRAVVATYTKALQQQLVQKDLPFLRKVIGDFRYALSLGGENYLCLRRFEQLRIHDLFEEAEKGPLNRLFEWSTRTRTGLRTELDFEPPPSLWIKACRESDLCFGKDCPFHKDCFFQKAKLIEQQAHIIVANHHIFFADMATGGNVLPAYGAVVFDEAHQVEDVATDYLGIEISNFAVRYLLDSILSERTKKGLLTRLSVKGAEIDDVRGVVAEVRHAADNFFLDLADTLKEEPVKRIRKKWVVNDRLSGPLLDLKAALLRLKPGSEEEEQEIKVFANRATTLAAAVRHTLSQDMEDYVYWSERDNKRIRLIASPVNVSDALQENLFRSGRPAILTSATLSAGGSFDYIKGRLGLDEAAELILDSPFNYEAQAMLYISQGLGEQRDPGYQEAFERELCAILSKTNGRTLVLFTSYSHMRKTEEALRASLPHLNILCQGDIPAYRLVEIFKGTPNAVLFGTTSFWQGIDIPGDALQCVVIAKLPFAVPDDPIIEARMERLRRPFLEYQVPQAVLLFRQGFGRLIRTKTDRGAVAVLDSRIVTKNYGRWFLKSIPKCRVTCDLREFERFFDDLRAPAEEPTAGRRHRKRADD